MTEKRIISMSDIKIEKGVPLPELSRIPTLPLIKMDVGDSFVISASSERDRQTIRQRLSRFQLITKPKMFSMRKTDDEHVRVYRIDDALEAKE
jgi:hypothetical protein